MPAPPPSPALSGTPGRDLGVALGRRQFRPCHTRHTASHQANTRTHPCTPHSHEFPLDSGLRSTSHTDQSPSIYRNGNTLNPGQSTFPYSIISLEYWARFRCRSRRTLIRSDFRCFSPSPAENPPAEKQEETPKVTIARDERASFFCSASFQSCVPWIMYTECIYLFIYVIERIVYCDTNVVLEFVRGRRGISEGVHHSLSKAPRRVSVLISDWSREINVESFCLSRINPRVMLPTIYLCFLIRIN